MAGAKVPITFRIYKGDALVREETLTQPVIKVGKLSSSHLRLEDDAVSRMHAVIEANGPGDVSIIDLGSTKGTHVNGQKVNKARLQSGDQIVVGNTRIEISIGGAPEEEEDAPTKVHAVGSLGGPAPAASPPARPPAQMPGAAPGRAPGAMSGEVSSGQPAAPPRPAAPAAPPQRVAQPVTPSAAPLPPTARPGMSPAVGMAAAPIATAGRLSPRLPTESVDEVGGARAIEIAAMLGESVVGVKHLKNPQGGKVTALTKGLFIGGAFLLLMSVFAFAKGVGNAEFNKQAEKIWINELQKAPHDFRPRRLSLAFDWMAFGGAIAGLISLTYALARLSEERDSPFFRIGSAPEVEFPIDGAPGASFPLVGPLGNDFVFNFVPGMDGEVIVDGQPVKLVDLQASGKAQPSAQVQGAMQTVIPAQGRIRVNIGQNTFLVSSVPRPRRHPIPLFASMESRMLAFMGGSAVVHLSIVLLLLSLPPAPQSLSLDLRGSEGRLTRVQSKAQEDPKEEEEEDDNKDQETSGGTGTAMALDEGKMGKQDSDRATGRYQMKNEGADPTLAREAAIESARDAGFLGALRTASGGAFSSITGTGDFSSGLDDANVYGGLLGDEAGEMQGGFGFGRSGFGAGGGGTGWGTIGTGKYGTIGHGSGTGSGYGVGSGRGGMRSRQAVAPQVQIGNAVSTGDLDKNIIRRYIRQKLPQIKYCYEKQLLAKPDISGTVVSQFQISPQGAVLNSTAQGVHDEVSSCVANVIKTIQFPKPRGGGLVQVRYPFTFRPTGG